MSKHGLIPSLEKCKTCTLTNITRKYFPNNVEIDTSLLDLVHDLCDFHSTHFLGNTKYMITFIDDY